MNESPIINLIMNAFTIFIAYYINIQVNELNYVVPKSTKMKYLLACGIFVPVSSRLIVEIPLRLIVVIVVLTLFNRFITKNSYVFSAILSVYVLFTGNLAGPLATIVYNLITNISPYEYAASDYLFYHIITLLIVIPLVKLTRHKVADMEKILWSTGMKIGVFAVISLIPVFIIISTLLPMHYIIMNLSDNSDLLNKWTLLSFFLLLVIALYLAMSVYLVILYSRNKEMSQVDAMTGALSKEVGIKFIEESMNKARVRNNHLVVCFVDVDNLKMINDSFGHNEGDLLIKTVADTIQSKIRKTDKMIRFGGDEFIVVFRDMTQDTAKDIIERINHRLWEIGETRTYHIGISYGFAEYIYSKYLSVDDFISEADKNMYEFKSKHKKSRELTSTYHQLEIPYDIDVPTQSS